MDGDRGRHRRAAPALARRGERALSEKVPTPWWLRAVLGVQALGWLGQTAFAIFLVVFASGFPERWAEIALLVFAAVIALAVAGTFAVGAARPMEGPAARRFATTHWIAGALMVLPLVVAMIAQVVLRVGEGRSGDAASTTAFAIVVAVLPLAGIFASRRESPPLVVGSAVLGILWVLFGALLFVGLGVGMAGLSA